MALCIGLNDPKYEFQVKQPRAGLAHDFLPGHGRTWRVHVVDAHIEDISPSGGVCEKRPNDLYGRVDDGRWTARIRHRNFNSLSNTCERLSVEARMLFYPAGTLCAGAWAERPAASIIDIWQSA